MNKQLYAGIHAVLYAMFLEDESVDFKSMTKQVDYCLQSGCSGITVLGLATEVTKLTFTERKAIIKCVANANAGRANFSVTIAGNSVAEQVELGLFAQQYGADWLILQPPLVGNYGADTYLKFFERVANKLALPVAIQNAPQYLGRSLSASDIQRLQARCVNFACVKSEDSAIGVQAIIVAINNKLHVLGGRGGLEMTDSLRAGCEGFVVAPDIAPVMVRIFNAWDSGKIDEAEKLYAEAAPAITFVMQSIEHLITYGKRIFAINANLTVHDRSPCLAPSVFGLDMVNRWARVVENIANTKN